MWLIVLIKMVRVLIVLNDCFNDYDGNSDDFDEKGYHMNNNDDDDDVNNDNCNNDHDNDVITKIRNDNGRCNNYDDNDNAIDSNNYINCKKKKNINIYTFRGDINPGIVSRSY